MDEIRSQVLSLLNRTLAMEEASTRFKTPAEFAAWLDEEFMARDPQVPLANLYVLIDGL